MLTARHFVFGIALAGALLGCIGGQTGSEGAQANRGREPPVGSVASGCTSDVDCEAVLNGVLAQLEAPAQGAARRLVAFQCAASCGDPASSACECWAARGDSTTAEPFLLSGPSCPLFGRTYACLWPAEQLPACTPGTCDCERTCSHALDLLAADDAHPVHAQARAAQCEAGVCRYVFALDDRCYAGGLPTSFSPVVDCAESDDALLARARDAELHGSGERLEWCGVGGTRSVEGLPDAGVAACLQQGSEEAP